MMSAPWAEASWSGGGGTPGAVGGWQCGELERPALFGTLWAGLGGVWRALHRPRAALGMADRWCHVRPV